MRTLLLPLPRKVVILALACLAGLFAFNQVLAHSRSSPSLQNDSALIYSTDRRVAALDLKPEERKWEEVGWVSSLDEALERSHRLNRPIFVLGLAGDLDGRC